MCGICGFVYQDPERRTDPADLDRMCAAIVHRGPDDQGTFVRNNIALGMRRLSIIDLKSGAQPIFNETNDCLIVFNGEIYNYRSVREELEKKGHRFKTSSDTETILHAFEEWGKNCVTHLNGMFAFAIWDERNKALFLARDRLGIKPLYYYVDKDRLAFASELKSLLQIRDIPRHINLKALDTFLTFEYIPDSLSILEDIHKLPAAHTLEYKDGRTTVERYWDVQYAANDWNETACVEKLRELLFDAVKIRLMSEVPLGAFLSGGLDSSSIVAMMSQVSNFRVKTFSIGFDDRTYNELPFARAIASHFNTEHYEEFLKPDIHDLAEKLFVLIDEPFGDFSIFPTFLVSEMARKYVTVVLSGDGGDELLAGYDTYVAQTMAKKYQKLPRWMRKALIEPTINALPPMDKKKGLINRSRRFVEGMRLPDHLQHVRWMIFLQEAEKDFLYESHVRQQLDGYRPYEFIEKKFARVSSTDPLDQQQYVDLTTYLVDDILVKVDRMSMATSLEARVPFLDHRFVEFAASLPSSLRLQKGKTKYILKRAMQGILPEQILSRGKEGFSIPIKNWIKEELNPLMNDALSTDRLKETGLFAINSVHRMMNEHMAGQENHSHKLWALIVFQRWYRQYVKQ
ncbi:asparagine synthase (glutamine-hydrolyzing) [candidate division KSB1 bacterium]|nr:asparagine synthase (glutamine-hydrolyzing) [candidate division KSB1 bacterium]